MPAAQHLRIGTRRSLLALAQTGRFARTLMARWPGLTTELVPIDTRGDRRRDVALSAIDDDQFFTAELDEALSAGTVDLCVHSLKDLGFERPFAQIVPVREDPRDVVIFRRDAPDRLATGLSLRLGTSTVRRASNVVDFLLEALPGTGSPPDIQLVDIRGNVDQRLRQLLAEGGPYDAIVLALAGLNRLRADEQAGESLALLLRDVRWMVLPLEACPAAPGQGALSVEYRTDDARVRDLLAPLADTGVMTLIELERKLMQSILAADRNTFGITAERHPELGEIAWIRGRQASRDGSTIVERLVWNAPPRPIDAHPWEGSRWSARAKAVPLSVSTGSPFDAPAVYVAHARALESTDARPSPDCRIWAGGAQTWRTLARRGIWVEGCAEMLGFELLRRTLESPALQLPPLDRWRVLTHAGATASWPPLGISDAVATYRIDPPPEQDLSAEVAAATHFFWTSSTQFRGVERWLPADAWHACGPGKTARALREAGVRNLQIFPSVREWRAWLA